MPNTDTFANMLVAVQNVKYSELETAHKMLTQRTTWKSFAIKVLKRLKIDLRRMEDMT